MMHVKWPFLVILCISSGCLPSPKPIPSPRSESPHPEGWHAAYTQATNELNKLAFYNGPFDLQSSAKNEKGFLFVFRLSDVPDATIRLLVEPAKVTTTGGWFPELHSPRDED